MQGEEEGVVQQAQHAGHKAEGAEQQGLRKQGGGHVLRRDCIQRCVCCVTIITGYYVCGVCMKNGSGELCRANDVTVQPPLFPAKAAECKCVG